MCPSAFPNLRITSLAARGDILYTGMENGAILCIKCAPVMCISLIFNAYNRSVCSLMVMKPPKHATKHAVESTTSQKQPHHHTARQRKAPSVLKLHLATSPSERRKRLQSEAGGVSYRQSLDLSPSSFSVHSR